MQIQNGQMSFNIPKLIVTFSIQLACNDDNNNKNNHEKDNQNRDNHNKDKHNKYNQNK